MTNTPDKIIARLKVENRTPCLVWTGALDTSGYGLVRWNGKNTGVHRLTWEWSNGPIPEDHVIDHLCRNRKCANVEHLRCVPKRVNDTDNKIHASSAKTECAQGHPYDADNTLVSKRGWRICRECNRQRCKERRESK